MLLCIDWKSENGNVEIRQFFVLFLLVKSSHSEYLCVMVSLKSFF